MLGGVAILYIIICLACPPTKVPVAPSSPAVITKNVSRFWQCHSGGKNHPQLRTTDLLLTSYPTVAPLHLPTNPHSNCTHSHCPTNTPIICIPNPPIIYPSTTIIPFNHPSHHRLHLCSCVLLTCSISCLEIFPSRSRSYS